MVLESFPVGGVGCTGLPCFTRQAADRTRATIVGPHSFKRSTWTVGCFMSDTAITCAQ